MLLVKALDLQSEGRVFKFWSPETKVFSTGLEISTAKRSENGVKFMNVTCHSRWHATELHVSLLKLPWAPIT